MTTADDAARLTVLTNLAAAYPQLERPNWDRVGGWVRMILGQQTARGNVDRAMASLAPVLTADQLVALTPNELDARIHSVRFHAHKAVYIQNIMRWYLERGGDATDWDGIETDALRTELHGIAGVGEETADTMLLYSFHRPVFIADRYAMLLFNRLGFGPYMRYAQMRAAFMPLTEGQPFEVVRDWHTAIDRYGREHARVEVGDESWLTEGA